ncbi:MAG: GlsB/YeaQ/YmgE family stress response membrane protein [Saprospiraceae bacterium]|nr:GlsB/YeaQ/YmgE family stress response membrane protein [Saprospiraceae bacterium]
MGWIVWLITGLAAGALAKQLTPQEEKPGWVSSLITGIVGALLGGFIFGLVGIQSSSLVGSFIFALVGSVIFLFIYHRYLKDKIDWGSNFASAK